MREVRDGDTIRAVWEAAVRAHGAKPFVIVPRNRDRDYCPDGLELTFAACDALVRGMAERYQAAGYGVGHRVALLLENRPEFFIAKLALNALGVSCVPVNPDYRAGEIAYLIGHSKPELVLTMASRQQQAIAGIAGSSHKPPVLVMGADDTPPPPRARSAGTEPTPLTESSILYTSGTTGTPKGCMLSHGYEVSLGDWYLAHGGLADFRPGIERIYNPLPLYHVNSGIVSFFGAVLSGNAQVQPDRFHPERWWREVVQTRATVVHYLGVVIHMLMQQGDTADARGHCVRFGVGAGVEPQLHAAFEARFGFPLLEIWGMTETCRILMDGTAPRKVGTRAMGRAVPGLEVRVVDEADNDVADNTPGEMVVRHSARTPRRGTFLGYINNEEETEHAWRGGWFHTGDTVCRAPDGMLHFVDRKKNIIRRSGENIAAAEVEALLLTHPDVAQAAVLAVQDEIREEEVLACIVLKAGAGDRAKAEDIFAFCNARLAYYKPPGWIWFAGALPTTGTQKIQKHTIFPAASDPRQVAGMIDLRALKRRAGPAAGPVGA